MATKADLPPELIPVLDIIAEMVADSMIKEMEKQTANRDDAPSRDNTGTHPPEGREAIDTSTCQVSTD